MSELLAKPSPTYFTWSSLGSKFLASLPWLSSETTTNFTQARRGNPHLSVFLSLTYPKTLLQPTWGERPCQAQAILNTLYTSNFTSDLSQKADINLKAMTLLPIFKLSVSFSDDFVLNANFPSITLSGKPV